MTASELIIEMRKSDFSFTKPSLPKEIHWYKKQNESMDKLIVCGLAENIGKNKYSLTIEGRKASIIGIEKWAKSITDISKREFVYDCFGFFTNWYNLPRLKIRIEKIIKSNISNELWNVIKAVFILLIVWLIKILFGIELN